MFEAIKHNLESIAGIEIYPIISLSIFFGFFVMLGIWVFSYKKSTLDQLRNIPLEDESSSLL